MKLPKNINQNPNYFIVDEHDKIIERFRNKVTAINFLWKFKKVYGKNIKLIKKENAA